MKNITLHNNVILRASGNFRRALVSLCFDLGGTVSGIVSDRTQVSIWHSCVGIWRPATIQCRVNWQIGLEYLGTEMPLCLITPIGYEEFVSCLTSPGLQILKGDAKRLGSLERNDTLFSVPRKEGRLVNKPRIHKFKYLHNRFSVPSKKGRVDNKSSNSQINICKGCCVY
jgi:hypothetical protein